MKKLLLSTILLFCSLFVFADNMTRIDLQPTTSTSHIKRPRSVVIQPTVSVDTDVCQLTISMVSDESYTVYVYDGNGGVVYQGDVLTDGGRHVYLLPELDADLYSISIESQSTSYEGEFYAN